VSCRTVLVLAICWRPTLRWCTRAAMGECAACLGRDPVGGVVNAAVWRPQSGSPVDQPPRDLRRRARRRTDAAGGRQDHDASPACSRRLVIERDPSLLTFQGCTESLALALQLRHLPLDVHELAEVVAGLGA